MLLGTMYAAAGIAGYLLSHSAPSDAEAELGESLVPKSVPLEISEAVGRALGASRKAVAEAEFWAEISRQRQSHLPEIKATIEAYFDRTMIDIVTKSPGQPWDEIVMEPVIWLAPIAKWLEEASGEEANIFSADRLVRDGKLLKDKRGRIWTKQQIESLEVAVELGKGLLEINPELLSVAPMHLGRLAVAAEALTEEDFGFRWPIAPKVVDYSQVRKPKFRRVPVAGKKKSKKKNTKKKKGTEKR